MVPNNQPKTSPTERTLTIEGLGFGGEGYARTRNGFVSVHHTLPGDVVRVEAGPALRGRAWAEILSFERRSPSHVDPECPYYDLCTGCSLRHMSREGEISWKIGELRSILERHGPAGAREIPIDWLDTGARSEHRTRGRFRVNRRGGRIFLGLRSTSLSGHIVDIRDCPAQAKPFLTIMTVVAEELAGALGDTSVDSVEVRLPSPAGSSPSGGLVVLRGREPSRPLREALVSAATGLGCSVGHVNDEEKLNLWVGKPTVTVRHTRESTGPEDNLPTDLDVEVPWSSWYHATPGQAEPLLRWARDCLDLTHEHVVDLCAGVGALSFTILRPRRRILAVDWDHRALWSLESACGDAGLGEISIRPGKVGTILKRLVPGSSGFQPTAALINPMRRPLGAQLRELAALGIRQILYLGPSAVPAAKDLFFLETLGFHIQELAAVNLHPATGQVMLAANIER